MKATLLVIDDHPLVRDGIRMALQGCAWLSIVGEAAGAQGALDALSTLRPSLTTVDLKLAEGTGFDVLRGLQARSPATRALVLTIHAEQEYVDKAIALGACGYVWKGHGRDHLVQALGGLMRGQRYVAVPGSATRGARLGAASSIRRGGAAPSRRETEVLRLVADGLTSSQIAVRLGIGKRTVETHRQCLMQKLSARNRADLIVKAIRQGLIDVPL